MTLFLDTSTLLAACGSATGASRFVVENAGGHGWKLIISPYVAAELERNLPKFSPAWEREWRKIQPLLSIVQDVLTIPHPVVFEAAKDKPVLLSAWSAADILLVMDKADFAGMIADGFYGLRIMLPGGFLRTMRDQGRLRIP